MSVRREQGGSQEGLRRLLIRSRGGQVWEDTFAECDALKCVSAQRQAEASPLRGELLELVWGSRLKGDRAGGGQKALKLGHDPIFAHTIQKNRRCTSVVHFGEAGQDRNLVGLPGLLLDGGGGVSVLLFGIFCLLSQPVWV